MCSSGRKKKKTPRTVAPIGTRPNDLHVSSNTRAGREIAPWGTDKDNQQGRWRASNRPSEAGPLASVLCTPEVQFIYQGSRLQTPLRRGATSPATSTSKQDGPKQDWAVWPRYPIKTSGPGRKECNGCGQPCASCPGVPLPYPHTHSRMHTAYRSTITRGTPPSSPNMTPICCWSHFGGGSPSSMDGKSGDSVSW